MASSQYLGVNLPMSFCHGPSVLDSPIDQPRIFEMIPRVHRKDASTVLEPSGGSDLWGEENSASGTFATLLFRACAFLADGTVSKECTCSASGGIIHAVDVTDSENEPGNCVQHHLGAMQK